MGRVLSRSTGDGNLHPDGAAGQRLFDSRLPLPASSEFYFFNRICLEKPIQLNPIAPPAPKVVIFQVAALRLADNRISPAGKLHGETGHFGAEPGLGVVTADKPQ